MKEVKKISFGIDVWIKDDVDVNDVFKLMNEIENVCKNDKIVDEYEVTIFEDK